MTALQARNARNVALNNVRLAKLRARCAAVNPVGDELLAQLRKNVEGTEHHADGTVWGLVYLHNAGAGHSFAGHLSALKARGLYRETGNRWFGMVLMG